MGRLIDKRAWRVIEITIMRYPVNKRKLEEALEDIILTKGSTIGKTNYDTEYSKPQSVVESKALKLNKPYYLNLKRKVEAVEKAYNSLRPEEQMVIKTRFWTHSDRKTPYERMLNTNYSVRQMQNIVQKTFYQIGLYLGEIE